MSLVTYIHNQSQQADALGFAVAVQDVKHGLHGEVVVEGEMTDELSVPLVDIQHTDMVGIESKS